MKESLLVLLVTPIIIFTFVTVSHSQYTITQLTNNGYDEGNPQINNNGKVARYGYDGSDYEIFLYDGTIMTQITNNPNPDYSPRPNDRGELVWFQYDGSDFEIFLCGHRPFGVIVPKWRINPKEV